MKIPKSRILLMLLLVSFLFVGGGIVAERAGLLQPVKRPIAQWVRHHERPNIAWTTVDPGDVGLDREALDDLRSDLERWETRGFLVARGGSIAYEWYKDDFGPNLTSFTASVAKAFTGSTALALAMELGAVDLDDKVHRYVPEWRSDSVRARARIRHLAYHSSGIENVSFVRGAQGELGGWKQAYYENPAGRFRIAIEHVPFQFEPGTRYEYSGVGYYVLAYILAGTLGERGHSDIKVLLKDRVMRPLGIPDDAWSISYGTSYQVDDRKLYALGSGGTFTLRAAARVTDMVMRNGRWEDQRILDGEVLARLLDPGSVPDHSPHPDRIRRPWGAPATGWYLNSEGAWPSLPRDAFLSVGDRHQILLAVPSWDLVAVRLGQAPLGEPFIPGALGEVEDLFFAPLARAVRAPAPPRPSDPPTY